MLWIAIIVVVVIVVLLLWWWLGRCPEAGEKTRPAARPSAEILPPAPAWRGEATAAGPVAPGGVTKTPTPEMAAEAAPAAEAATVVVEETAAPLAAEPVTVEAEPAAPVVAAEATQPPAPDDLKVIEGIGPKISAMLNAEGIYTFAQLAATDVERLRAIMQAANLRIADPTTWPQQAALAAAGRWDELKALQESLKGGRRA